MRNHAHHSASSRPIVPIRLPGLCLKVFGFSDCAWCPQTSATEERKTLILKILVLNDIVESKHRAAITLCMALTETLQQIHDLPCAK